MGVAGDSEKAFSVYTYRMPLSTPLSSISSPVLMLVTGRFSAFPSIGG